MKTTKPIGKYLTAKGSPTPKYTVTLKTVSKGNPRRKKLV